MFRRDAALAIGGYDSRLRQAGAEGCEDYLFQIQIARRYPFGVVPEPVIGYRKHSAAMSADGQRMLHSRILALQLLELEGAPALPIIQETKAAIRLSLAIAYARERKLTAAVKSIGEAALDAPLATWPAVLRHALFRTLRNKRIGVPPRPLDPSIGLPFLEMRPEEAIDVGPPAYLRKALQRLAPLDEALRAGG
jgi:hypothetical protein